MKKTKTIKDHIRYYRTYGGITPRKRTPTQPLADTAPAPAPTPKADPTLARAMKQLKNLETKVAALTNEPKPVPQDPAEARARARDARSIRALEARVRELESRPTISPGLELARARLAKAEEKRAKRVKETNATPSVPSRTDNRPT